MCVCVCVAPNTFLIVDHIINASLQRYPLEGHEVPKQDTPSNIQAE